MALQQISGHSEANLSWLQGPRIHLHPSESEAGHTDSNTCTLSVSPQYANHFTEESLHQSPGHSPGLCSPQKCYESAPAKIGSCPKPRLEKVQDNDTLSQLQCIPFFLPPFLSMVFGGKHTEEGIWPWPCLLFGKCLSCFLSPDWQRHGITLGVTRASKRTEPSCALFAKCTSHLDGMIWTKGDNRPWSLPCIIINYFQHCQ